MSFIQCYRSVLRLIIIPLLISTFLLHSNLINVSHAQITLDGSMGPGGPLTGPDYDITSNLGQIRGSNLFHSFGKFNVLTGESATFSGPGSIANILSRVTGGNQSFIDGLLRSTIPGANLFLLNPAGVLFGANASLDVSGAFHVSTANYLRFNDGAMFHADLSKTSTLTVAEPAAFGFLSNNPAAISIDQSFLQVPAGETLSVIGGDIDIMGSTSNDNLSAPGGRINITSVASPGEVVSNAPGGAPDLQVDSFGSLGTINLSQDAVVQAGGDGGGTVIIRGGKLMMDNSFVYADTKGPAVVPLVGEPGAGIDIQVTEDVVLDNGSEIATNVWPNVAPGIGSGGIRVKTDSLEVTNFSFLQSAVFWQSTGGNAGDIEVDANNVLVRDGGLLWSATGGAGDSANITVNTGSLEVRDGGRILTYVFGGTGNAGNINLEAENILLSNTNVGGMWTAISSWTDWSGTGNAGNISVTSDSLQILGGGNTEISSITWWLGQGGNVDLAIDGDVTISGSINNKFGTGIFANTFGWGDGGNLNLKSNSLNVTTSSLQSRTLSWWGGTGDAGNTTINTGSLELRDGGAIFTDGFFGSGGNAGHINVHADSVLISGYESSPVPFRDDYTGLSSNAGAAGGTGGDVRVTTNSLVMTQRGAIQASTFGPDNGGIIEINAGSVEVLDGSNILANAWSSGDGGNINVNADSILISGVNNEPHTLPTGDLTLSGSAIASQAATDVGSAGDVQIVTSTLKILDGGVISTGTWGHGDGGNIVIEADSTLVSGENLALKEFLGPTNEVGALSNINASSNNNLLAGATGIAGNIKITSGNFQLQDKGRVSTSTSTPGTGGNLELVADQVTLSGGASIAATSTVSPNAGKAGDISITAHSTFQSDNSTVITSAEQAAGGDITLTAGQDVLLRNGTLVSAESSGSGDAGNITISAGNTYLSENSSVTTVSKQADGGNIELIAQYMAHLINSDISSSVNGGPDTVGGNITIDPEYVILQNSRIMANAFEGNGGNISITAGLFMADPSSVVSASSAMGVNGEVNIHAPVTNISGSIAALQNNYSSAASLLHKSCAVRMSGGEYSSLVVQGDDGLPIGPGDLLPSPLYVGEMVESDVRVASLLNKEPLIYGINVFEEKGLLPLTIMNDDSGCSSCPE